MPRTGTRFGLHDLRFLSQSPLRRIEPVNQQLIKPEICDNRKAIVRRQRNSMSMRTFLPLRIYARTLVLNKRKKPRLADRLAITGNTATLPNV